jgi:TonB family protein
VEDAFPSGENPDHHGGRWLRFRHFVYVGDRHRRAARHRKSMGLVQGLWHMTDARQRYEQQIEVAGSALARGDRPAAVDALNAAIDATRIGPDLQRERATALIRLGLLKQELGLPAEAERILTGALGTLERHLGPEHPDLIVPLNELSRLHIRQSAFARAEPLLARLLKITRTKGKEHPDVATVLAGLAVVRRGVGADAAAEKLYRCALEIREKALAPNHMAIVITLEQLSETCAAQKKFGEALALLQRALPTRVQALGEAHATVRTLRERIAGLELQISSQADEVPTQAAAPAPIPPPEPAAPVASSKRATPSPAHAAQKTPVKPDDPKALAFLYQPETPSARKAPPTRERVATPQFTAAVAAVSFMTGPTQMPASAHPAPSAQMIASTSRAVPTPVVPLSTAASIIEDTVGAPTRPAIGGASVVDDGQIQTAGRHLRERSRARTTSLETQKRKTTIGAVTAAVVVLAIVGLAVSSYAWKTRNRMEAQSGAELRREAHGPAAEAVATVAAPVAVLVAAPVSVAVAPPDSSPPASVSPPPVAPTATAPEPSAQRNTPTVLPSAPVALSTVARLVVPNIAAPNVDSIVRASTKTTVERESYADQIATAGKPRAPELGDDRAVSPPSLIGTAPRPRFPDALRAQRMEGDVVVRFIVDVNGRVDPTSMMVVRSPHELFTTAVRNVLPNFRFEPARTAPPKSKPVAEWIQFSIRFSLER